MYEICNVKEWSEEKISVEIMIVSVTNMICPNCGSILADNEPYCENCGFDPDFICKWDD